MKRQNEGLSLFLTCVAFFVAGLFMAAYMGKNEKPPLPRLDIMTETYHLPSTRYLVGPMGYEVLEFRTAAGANCLMSEATKGGLSCQWHPAPE